MIDLLLEHFSYFGLAALLILCGAGLPLPEEAPVVLAGVLAADGTLNPWLAFIACLVGAVGGDSVMYAIGRYFGRGVLKEHPRLAGFLTPQRERQIEGMIQRHGVKALFLARFMIGVRSAVYLTAGIVRVPYRIFLVLDAACATIVIGVAYGLGYAFGDQIQAWIRRGEVVITGIVLGSVVIVGCAYYYGKKRQAALPDPRLPIEEDDSDDDPPSPAATSATISGKAVETAVG